MDTMKDSVRAQSVTVNDLKWTIEHLPERCTMCGRCLAACPFHAIEAGIVREDSVMSTGTTPAGISVHRARPVIRQAAGLARACTGCATCQKVCPNHAIRPVRNIDNRQAVLSRESGKPTARGGRNSLNVLHTLDHLIVGRISQMTDPSLDAERHTFDIRSPLGRVLAPEDLPLTVKDGKLTAAASVPPVRWIYPLILSDMSIGALSTRAWEAVALACAYLNEKCDIPIRMCSGEGGMPVKLLESEYLKYCIIQIASGHFGWNRIIQALPHMKEDPAAVLIKVGQGAKPGDGGLLPAAKVGPHIQAIRGIPKATFHSPPNHQGLYSIEESVQKMHLSMNAAFGFRVPVAVKCAASATSVSVYNNLLRDPYKICGGFFLDGIEGGTGAAAEVSLDHTGHPIVSKIRDCYLSAVKQGLQGQIPLYGGGGIGLTGEAAADAFKLICLGANGVFCGKLITQILGCVSNEQGRCNACNTGKCPTGICTQDPRLVKRLDVDKGAQAIVDYVRTFDKELRKLLAPVGNSTLPVGRSDALVTTNKEVAERLGVQYVC